MDSPNFEAETQESKRRKVMEKNVITVKIEASEGKKKSEGPPPSDNWSWRKYGQKPIKGSPYPRGYYRCSTSKGCSAKKQVERCKNDASMLIITYTSTHNHSGPDIPTTKHLKDNKSSPNEDHITTPKQEEEEEEEDELQKIGDGGGKDNENPFYYCQSPTHDSMIYHREDPFAESIGNTYGSLGVIFDEEPLDCPLPLINFSKIKSEEYDFYDELEELPTSSIFTSFMRKDIFDERILVHPS